LRQLKQSLERLQADHVDERLLHNVWDYARLDQFTRKGCGLEAAA
jgi:predicted aldo/keto reductase-like oxidoreductase